MSQPLAYDLTDRSALITGASRGLGAEIARVFAAAGADLALVARDGPALDAATDAARHEASHAGQLITSHRADLNDIEALDPLVQQVLQQHGRVDILINNAAIQGPIGPLERLDFKAWRRAIDTNLIAPARLCQLLIPEMRERSERGKIINLSGGGATRPRPHFTAYAASKCALVRLTETLAEELNADPIDVNAMAPGPMNTRMLEEVLAAGPEGAPLEFEEAMKRSRQKGGTPARAAELALFLASRASDGISGRLISALWDDWESLRGEDLAGTDLYTLRRVSIK